MKREWEGSQFIALQQLMPYNFTDAVGEEGWCKPYMPSHEPKQLCWLAVRFLPTFQHDLCHLCTCDLKS